METTLDRHPANGLPLDHRVRRLSVRSAKDLIDRCRELLDLDDATFRREEEVIRSNYMDHLRTSRKEFLNLTTSLSG